MPEKSERERCAYHALRKAGISNYAELKKLRARSGSWRDAWASIGRENYVYPAPFYKRCGIFDPEFEREKVERAGIRLIMSGEEDFPALLREIPFPPFGIYVKGKLPRPTVPAIGIVGTRKATEEGRETARRFAEELSDAGIAIVSGLAFGIDAAAHAGCLDANGTTVAVLANGLDSVYPRSHERLSRRILAQGGCLISEYPPDTPSFPNQFLERNRLISGLSIGVVVIEAPHASGSLATARFAFEQNREVFVVPGPARHPNFKGSHELIRSGARLAASAADVLEDLNFTKSSAADSARSKTFETKEEQTIFETLSGTREPLEIDKIIEIAHLEPNRANQALTMLLLKNAIKEEKEGYTVK